MIHWYQDEKKVIELAEFLTESGQIKTTDELIEYFKHPSKYTEVWDIYQKEILGTVPIHSILSKKLSPNNSKKIQSPIKFSESCACGIKNH